MYRNAVKYKEHGWLAPGSHAMELYQAKKFLELDKHLKQLEIDKRKLEGTYKEKSA